uniref:Methyltransferase n=1 Tax=Solanum tuberosum TaxID=4113 RepID=M0ZSX1_SOLTU
MKRLMLLEENQIAFHSQDGMMVDDVKDYSHLIAEMIGLGSDTEFLQAGVRTVLDIGCGFGSFSAHLLSLNLMALCVAAYGSSGSHVQVALERGLPAVIGNFISKQLPFPSLSYDMVHCAQCGIIWDSKDGLFLIEIDRVLKPGGYFVLTSSTTQQQGSSTGAKKGIMSTPLEDFTKKLCWSLLEQQDETFIWQKTVDSQCYTSGKQDTIPICKGQDMQLYYQPLAHCISGTGSDRWIPIHSRSDSMNSTELKVHGKCEPFPTYPRTYDLLHGNGLLSHLESQGCSIVEVLFEMDRILRPEGWIILSDKLGPIEKVRMVATQMRWEARVIDLQDGSDQRLLVCQKSFVRK